MRLSAQRRILSRFLVLSSLGVLGAIFFVPSIIASANPRPTTAQLFWFVFTISVVCIAAAWFGLRFADAANLPMPYLRRLDQASVAECRRGIVPAALIGVFFGICTILILRYFHVPNLRGSLLSRVAIVFFAAGSLELVVHLLIMSMAVRIFRGRIWAGIVVAAIVFVGFHATGLAGQSVALIMASILVNGTFGLALGLCYAKYGFEYVVLCHATAHILAVGVA